MLRIVRLAPVVLLSLVTNCSDSTGPVSLALNRARWEKQNLHEYIYTATKECFCANAGQEVYVLVLADTVFRAWAVGTNVEFPRDEWLTVDQLFAVAQHPSASYEKVRVEFDPELGYPKLVELSCSRTIFDCGLRLEAKNLGGLVSN
jgi:hypothetical protein